MVQRGFRQIRTADPDAKVTIATSRSQVSAIHNQLGDHVGISVEPYRRDTFPAIALATAYLADVQGIDPEEPVVVCPVDPYVEDDYFEALKQLSEQAEKGEANLVLIGIEPTYPSEKYGYIIPADKEPVTAVSTFKEKPTKDVAEAYIRQGALWNGGVFAYKMKYVVEKETSIQVMRFGGSWKDLGTWNTLTEAMEENVIGNGIMNEQCSGVHIVNEMDVPILAMGLHDVVISGTGRTLVDGMEQSVKPGDVIAMSAGCRHTIFADTELKLIEVQLGKEISVQDKKKYELEA